MDSRFRGNDGREYGGDAVTSLAAESPVDEADTQAMLRPAETVMRLARLGSFHPTRLSFGRSLLRRMGRDGWRLSEVLRQLDDDGYGRLVYEIETPQGRLSFAAFSNALAPEERT